MFGDTVVFAPNELFPLVRPEAPQVRERENAPKVLHMDVHDPHVHLLTWPHGVDGAGLARSQPMMLLLGRRRQSVRLWLTQ